MFLIVTHALSRCLEVFSPRYSKIYGAGHSLPGQLILGVRATSA